MRALTVAALSLLAFPAAAEEAAPLGDRLDMTSFRNSIGPRREEGLKTLADYGLTPTGDGVTYENQDPESAWRFVVTPLKADDGLVLACIEDEALNGGSYHTRVAIAVVEGPEGLLVASPDPVTHPDCQERH